MTAGGEGIIGVRVSVDKSRGASNYGFTLTRPGGWFDLLVNGGGAVSLQFQRSVALALQTSVLNPEYCRSPFKPVTRTSYVPWNQIHVMEAVVMASSPQGGLAWPHTEQEARSGGGLTAPCPAHTLPPALPALVTRDAASRGGVTLSSDVTMLRAVTPSSGRLVTRLAVPGTGVHLVHSSSSAPGHREVLALQLTPASPAPSLHRWGLYQYIYTIYTCIYTIYTCIYNTIYQCIYTCIYT